ncbi:alcohol dehydrogenase-like 1 isoform X2 [Olea europaea subsp. europaea]|uniref:Alcohol dehydrogenase-like 1 isoform X2 n=1 Tax=Olea europaea subsp. europaea TaxID=158383 RepID=A0A8S0S3A8_OLEEU|nr:alcohol dehydrogenase-like 1 isoform X2 [Olea europaea subsp. europaea]
MLDLVEVLDTLPAFSSSVLPLSTSGKIVLDFINPTNSDKSISDLVKEMTGGLGVDYCFECTWVAQLVNEALEATTVGIGTVIMLGAGTQKSMEINFSMVLCCIYM